jgi:multidrug efflux pump subunit AcrA (membrane-fusion protein)
VVVVLLLVVWRLAGYSWDIFRGRSANWLLAAESKSDTEPARGERSAGDAVGATSSLVLPGNIQAVTEAPVLARASGYIKTRSVDIGDRVKAGQVLAEIEAPELDQQIRQAQAASIRPTAPSSRARRRCNRGSPMRRWPRSPPSARRSSSTATWFPARITTPRRCSTPPSRPTCRPSARPWPRRAAAPPPQANLARLNDLKNYLTVRAPFAGVITVRNIDVGALVTEGSTLLYRIAQTDRLRTYLNVPQADSGSVRVGQQATLHRPDLPAASSRPGDAHRQRARPRQPHPADRSAGG